MLYMPRARLLAALTLATLALHMSGCLAYEIRNELRQANASLDDVKLRLATVNDSLLKLERTNTVLSDLDMKLSTLEATNASLASIDSYLASLRRALTALADLDAPDDEQDAKPDSSPSDPG